MPVHPQIAEFLSTLPPADGTPPDVAGWRAMGEAHLLPLEERLPVHSVTDFAVSMGRQQVPIRVYSPAEGNQFNILVYIHGGAFFSGSLETHDAIARALCNASGFRVISVGYRLAPESEFPAGLDDCWDVLRWVDEHPEVSGWNGEKLALAGDSSGGNFVAALAGMAHDQRLSAVTHQVLLYPSVDLDFVSDRYPSLQENATGFGLETVALKPHNSFYFASGADPSDPRVSPMKRSEFSGLPQALVITAEFDPLRDEGEVYASRLTDAGVPTTVHRYAGATHGFVQYFSWLPEYAGVFDEVGEFLNAH